MSRVQIVKEVRLEESESTLCFQWCRYIYDDGELDYGYRFIWRRDGKLMPHRGQARIPSMRALEHLIAQAKRAGWGDHKEGEYEALKMLFEPE